jgi:hypothetical protein
MLGTYFFVCIFGAWIVFVFLEYTVSVCLAKSWPETVSRAVYTWNSVVGSLRL